MGWTDKFEVGDVLKIRCVNEGSHEYFTYGSITDIIKVENSNIEYVNTDAYGQDDEFGITVYDPNHIVQLYKTYKQVATDPTRRICRNCTYFKRHFWSELITKSKEREPQCGGECEVLLKILQIDGNVDYSKEFVYVQDTFGCIGWKEKQND